MHYIVIQPPSGGCVLKQDRQSQSNQRLFQPPSGGCVLKPPIIYILCLA